MAQPDRQPGVAPGVVASIEAAIAARRGPTGADTADPRAAEQLISAMQTVKAARFSAAERLERKQLVSVVALSIVSLYFVGLSVWQALYACQPSSEPANRLITLVSIMSSIATMVLALIEAMNDYKMKAHFMHTCALQVNDLLAGAATSCRPPIPRPVQDHPPALQRTLLRRLPLQPRTHRLPDGAARRSATCHGRRKPAGAAALWARRLRPLRRLPHRPAAGADPVPLTWAPTPPGRCRRCR